MPARLVERRVQQRRAESSTSGRFLDGEVRDLTLAAGKPGDNITPYALRGIAIGSLLSHAGEVHRRMGKNVSKRPLGPGIGEHPALDRRDRGDVLVSSEIDVDHRDVGPVTGSGF